MGKPLKSKHLNKHKRLREQVLSRQGVSVGKRKRLGHSSHFAKVEHIPIVRKQKDSGGDKTDTPGELVQKKKKGKFNKFKQDLGNDGVSVDGPPSAHGDDANHDDDEHFHEDSDVPTDDE